MAASKTSHVTTVGLSTCLCPHCGVELNATTNINDEAPPRPGDLSICFYCAGFLIFSDKLALEKLSHEQLEDSDETARASIMEAKRRILELRKQEMERSES